MPMEKAREKKTLKNERGSARLNRRDFFRRGAATATGALFSLAGYDLESASGENVSAGQPSQLPKRRLGRTGLMVSVLAYGGAPLFEEVPTPIPEEAVAKMLHEAMDMGLNFIDVSHLYGRGYSEKAFGKAIRGRRDKVVIFSRCPMRGGRSAGEMVDESLERLGTDYIDVYGMHGTWMSEDTADALMEQLLPDLEKAKEAGKIRHIGTTCHQAPTAMVKMIETGKIEVVEVPVNPFWREFLEVVIPVAKKKDVGVIAMKSLWRGRLLLPSAELDTILGSSPEERLESCIGFGVSQELASVSIGFLHEPHIGSGIGTALRFKGFSEERAKLLRPKAHESVKDNCRICNRCLPCPVRIDVPRVLRLEVYARHYGLGNWAKTEYRRVRTKADQCTKCGKCTEQCPYGVPAQELILRAAKELA